jgi:hypothetical protein
MAGRHPVGPRATRARATQEGGKSIARVSGIRMLKSTCTKVRQKLQIIAKETLIGGEPVKIECVEIGGQTYAITRGPVTVVGLEDDWYEDVRNPDVVVETLSNNQGFKPDIFTFWQRLPDIEPKYSFRMEWEDLAVLPVKSYDHWWKHQIKSNTRNHVRKAEKEGVELREVDYDDDFVRGMTAIFNEVPVRQGRRFCHYGKEFETVKRQFSRFLFRESMIGAYFRDELIGFVMLGNAGQYGIAGQIISSIKHRDKAPNNALIAKSVEVCEKKQLSYLVYYYWTDGSLTTFKRQCGFEKTRVPRYFVPLTLKGRLGLKLGVHRGWKAAIPTQIKIPLKRLRRFLYESYAERLHGFGTGGVL